MIKIKLCGVRTVEDAMKCVSCGADAVGVVLTESPRKIRVEDAKLILKSLPPFVTPAAVAMPRDAEEAVELVRTINPGVLQLQGEEPPEMLALIKEELPGICLVKAVHVGGGHEVERARLYEGVADAILLDTVSPGRGGSGQTHDWSVSRKVVTAIKKPVVLAGGLNPGNVARAIREVGPYAVDVASGVEGEGRVKDVTLIKSFIRNAREASDGR